MLRAERNADLVEWALALDEWGNRCNADKRALQVYFDACEKGQ